MLHEILSPILLGLFTILLWIAASIALLLSLVLWIECVAALGSPAAHTGSSSSSSSADPELASPGSSDTLAALDPPPSPHPKTVIVIPAHNEAEGIAATLNSLRPQLTPADQILVVADNCTDTTTAIAQANGATVIERHNPDQRGKGYALDFGLRHLDPDPPEILVMIDADCDIQPGMLDQLVQRSAHYACPSQAIYLMTPPDSPSPKNAIASFAFRVKNLVRPLGLDRFGFPCFLTGTGMAFPWTVICAVDLASGHIVEDMKLGLDLALAGHSPRLCPTAFLTGRLPQQQSAIQTQRTRWEHGHLQILITYGPKLVFASIQQRRLDLLILALDLMIPPLSLFVMLWIGGILVAGSLGWIGAIWGPFYSLLGSGSLLLTAILMAWIRFGQQDLPLKTLLLVPVYLLWKIPIYLNFWFKPQREWVRTERDPVDVSN